VRLAFAFCVLFAALFSSGCGENPRETEEMILKEDPSFREELGERDAIQAEADAERDSYRKKADELDAQISLLKEQITIFNRKKADLRGAHAAALEDIRKKVAPQKRALEQDLAEKKRLLKRKEIELRHVARDIEEIKGLVDKKERLSLTREEVQVWNDRYSSLTQHRSGIEKEIIQLKNDIEITKLKIKVLKVD
jgi:chromosome segregation ATPase